MEKFFWDGSKCQKRVHEFISHARELHEKIKVWIVSARLLFFAELRAYCCFGYSLGRLTGMFL